MSIFVDIEKNLDGFRLNMQLEADNIPIALLGASGSGKSMTLRCIAGVEKPDHGKIVIDGQCVFDSEKKINIPPQERGTGLLFQNYALFPTMTVRQNIMCGARRSRKYTCVDALIRQFGLENLDKRLPSELSGGQQQRVALARILASQPRILMLDEPFSALDAFLRWQVEQQMSEVIESFPGTTILVSHNREEAYRLCQKIAVVQDGKTHGLREKRELFCHPQTQAAAHLVGMENVLDAQQQSDGTIYVPAWNISFTPKSTVPNVRAVSVPAQAFTLEEPPSEYLTVNGCITRIMHGPTDAIVLITPQQGRGVLHWRTCDTSLQRDQSIRLYLPLDQIHLLTE